MRRASGRFLQYYHYEKPHRRLRQRDHGTRYPGVLRDRIWRSLRHLPPDFTLRDYQDEQGHLSHYAARFSAKEAVVKALGTGFGEMAAFHDIEIINDDKGKPEVFFSDTLNSRFKNPEVLISISHCGTYVATVAIRIK